MFVIRCPRHGSRVLVSERRIRALRNTGTGILLDVECWCGQRVLLRTGRRTDAGPVRAGGAARRNGAGRFSGAADRA